MIELATLARSGAIAAVLLSLTAGARADAPDNGAFGRLTAQSNGAPMVPRTAVTIETGDGGSSAGGGLYDAAHAAAESALRQAGMSVDTSGRLVLAIRVDTGAYDFDALPPPDAPPPPSDRAVAPKPRAEVVNQVRVPLGRLPGGAVPSYALHIDLYRPGEPPVWSATVQADARTAHPGRLVGCMTAAAMAALGASAERELALGGCAKAPA